MYQVFNYIYRGYIHFIYEKADTRLNSYFLMGNPYKILALIGCYFYFVTRLGPRILKNREPFDLKVPLILYNGLQIVLNILQAILVLRNMIRYRYDLTCQEINFSSSPAGLMEAKLMYSYFLIKTLDLLDTIVFTLRKKWNQITFLHIYHHLLMCILGYFAVQYSPGGNLLIMGFINGVVHVVMYFYYLLSAIRPENVDSLPWKRHITQIQLIQFAILMIYFGNSLLSRNCNFPKFWLFTGFSQGIVFSLLFTRFYKKSYGKVAIS